MDVSNGRIAIGTQPKRKPRADVRTSTEKPNVRTDRARPNEIDIYGFRPPRRQWRIQSPYEFLMALRAEALLTPTYYENQGLAPRTQWTEAGGELIRSKDYKDGNIVAKPGIHYIAVPAKQQEYVLFPEQPHSIFETFRHAWVLVRKKRPDVIVIEGLKMPSTSRSPTENAKYCSLFFRPWTSS